MEPEHVPPGQPAYSFARESHRDGAPAGSSFCRPRVYDASRVGSTIAQRLDRLQLNPLRRLRAESLAAAIYWHGGKLFLTTSGYDLLARQYHLPPHAADQAADDLHAAGIAKLRVQDPALGLTVLDMTQAEAA